jgi:hypothetical protein
MMSTVEFDIVMYILTGPTNPVRITFPLNHQG